MGPPPINKPKRKERCRPYSLFGSGLRSYEPNFVSTINEPTAFYIREASVGREGLLTDKSVPVEKKRCPGTREEQVLANGAV